MRKRLPFIIAAVIMCPLLVATLVLAVILMGRPRGTAPVGRTAIAADIANVHPPQSCFTLGALALGPRDTYVWLDNRRVVFIGETWRNAMPPQIPQPVIYDTVSRASRPGTGLWARLTRHSGYEPPDVLVSPDGRRALWCHESTAYPDDNHPHVTDLATGEEHVLRTPYGQTHLCWLPDGHRWIVQVTDSHYRSQWRFVDERCRTIWRIDGQLPGVPLGSVKPDHILCGYGLCDAGRLVPIRLTPGPAPAMTTVEFPDGTTGVRPPLLSPRGGRLAWLTSTGASRLARYIERQAACCWIPLNASAPTGAAIYITDTDGRNLRKAAAFTGSATRTDPFGLLAERIRLRWRPDGKAVSYVYNNKLWVTEIP